MKIATIQLLLATAVTGFLTSCGGGTAEPQAASTKPVEIYKPKEEPKPANPNGVGPVKELALAEFNPALADEGEKIFTNMCTACHKMDKRHVGPALTGVLERRNPAWVMNMILNPDVMVKEDPTAKALLAEYLSPMANQNLTEDQARAVVEYFRKYDQGNI